MTIGKGKASAPRKLKVVFDTNVYVSISHFPGGVLLPLWDHARKGTYELIVSPAIIRELAKILRGSFGWDEEKIAAQLRIIAHAATIVTPRHVPAVVREDSADDQIIACAVEGKAALIVTGDRDLLRLKEYQGIGIVRPVDFLRTIGEGNTPPNG